MQLPILQLQTESMNQGLTKPSTLTKKIIKIRKEKRVILTILGRIKGSHNKIKLETKDISRTAKSARKN